MNNQSRPVARRHHTVPRFYLQGFSEAGKIATVRLPGDQRFPQSVGDAAVAKDFYAVDGHPDGPDVIEKALSEIEGLAAAVFKKIAGGSWPLGHEDRMTLGYFVALQATRVPVQRNTMDYLAAQMLRLQIGASGKTGLRKQLEEHGLEVSDDIVEEVWEQMTRPQGPPVKRPKTVHIEQMLDLSGKLIPYLVGRPWSLVRFERRSLILSDAPVGLVAHTNDKWGMGVGFMTAWGITFPLSRKAGLLMNSVEPQIELGVPVEKVHQGRADWVQDGTAKMEKFFNFHTVQGASEWLFHHPDDEKYVPTDLPNPRPVTLQMSGGPPEFDGEQWFTGGDTKDASTG
ncbi:DUF4238 domain-containing protein [Phytoactinopolyspora halophila]|uniref:DUF4238 domain-containing protein n=1 Tax=Phytoactinopolyspora halophila TaxID=1981511 RepID=UPI001314FB7C|nr:DUF4238 domain-containing protein [Phytoactinopolyspora halophila]